MNVKIEKTLLEDDEFNSYTSTYQSFSHIKSIEIYREKNGHQIMRLVTYNDVETFIKEFELDSSTPSPRILIKESTDD